MLRLSSWTSVQDGLHLNGMCMPHLREHRAQYACLKSTHSFWFNNTIHSTPPSAKNASRSCWHAPFAESISGAPIFIDYFELCEFDRIRLLDRRALLASRIPSAHFSMGRGENWHCNARILCALKIAYLPICRGRGVVRRHVNVAGDIHRRSLNRNDRRWDRYRNRGWGHNDC